MMTDAEHYPPCAFVDAVTGRRQTFAVGEIDLRLVEGAGEMRRHPKWTARASELIDEPIRCLVDGPGMVTHETHLPRSWHQQLNGVTELLSTTVVGEFDAK